MFQHWLHCYRIFEQDKKYLKHVYELRYEDYVENPDKYHQEIAAFIGTRVPEPPKEDTFRIVLQQWHRFGLRVPERAMEIPSAVYNKKYFNRWSYFLTRSPLKGYYRYIARKYEPEFAKVWLFVDQRVRRERGSTRLRQQGFCCFGSDVLPWSGSWRLRAALCGAYKGLCKTGS